MKDYKKILEGVVNIISATEKCDIGFVNICSYIGENCPELAESKDEEKIRKALIHMVTSNKELHFGINNYNGVIWEDILAWLEKQGEQKPAWSALDERNLEEIIDVIKANKNNAPNCDLPTYDRFLSWLQSLRPQNKYAYNPYKAVVESIAEMCKHYDKASHSGLRDFYDNVKVKCKDAKEYDSLFPQSTWMPSDEQMEALDDFIYAKYPNTEKYGAAVKSLYQDLKQLKEK